MTFPVLPYAMVSDTPVRNMNDDALMSHLCEIIVEAQNRKSTRAELIALLGDVIAETKREQLHRQVRDANTGLVPEVV